MPIYSAMGSLSRKQYIILIMVLLFSFFWTYKRHFDYPFPYHHDEWQHLGIAKQIIIEGYNLEYNPFIGVPAAHADLEPGFHIFLAVFFKVTGLDAVLFYKYLPAIFALLTTLAMFACFYEFTKNYYVSLSSSMFFIALTTNVNILGKEFFVPLSMAFFLMFFFIMLLRKSIAANDKNLLMASLLFYIVQFLIHPPSALILLLPLSIELFSARKMLKKEMVVLLLPIAIFCFMFFWKGSIITSKNYILDLILFERGWGKLEVSYFLPFLYGIIPTLLAVYGLFSNLEKYRFFGILAFVSLGITTLFNLSGFTLLVPYSRAVHYSMISLLLFTGLGLEKLSRNFLNYRYAATVAIFLFMLVPLYGKDNEFKNYSQLPLYQEDYESMKWIESNYGSENIIITPYFMTSAVYPVSGNKVISLIPAQMEGGLIEDNLNFYDYTCEKMKEVIKASNAGFVYSRRSLGCDFLSLVYSKKSYVYSIN